MKEEVMLHVLLAIAAVVGCQITAAAESAFTLFDDGDPVYSGGVYDLGGRGRPTAAATSAGAPYTGKEYLTVWGDTVGSTARNPDRLSVFVRSDVGLDSHQDWWVSFDVANDLVSPDIAFRLWLFNFKPDSTNLDMGFPEAYATFSFGTGDQLPGDDSRGGLWIEAMKTTGRTGIEPFRLDPDPDATLLRGGHNRVTVEWFVDAQVYRWTVSNTNGSFQVIQSASALALQPQLTYIAAGNISNSWGMGSGWTIWDISYGQGNIGNPPHIEKLVVDGRHRLFLDDRARKQVTGMRLVQGTLTKYASNPVIWSELPWEGSILHFPTVLRDADTGLFRMWYGAHGTYSAYATSSDGINWTKRLDLGTVPYEGSFPTNLVWETMGGMLQYCPDDPQAIRYKMMAGGTPPPSCPYGTRTLFSPDGLHWTEIVQACDTQLRHVQSISYDESTLRYVSTNQYSNSPRTAGRQESKDFIAWTPKVQILAPNANDPPGTEFYGMTGHRESDGWIGFPWVFHANPNEPLPRSTGPIDVELAWSADGFNWQRPFQGQVFLPLGPAGSWEDGMVFTASPPVRVGDELWFYYDGRNTIHGVWTGDVGCIGLAKLRLDGYAYLVPESESGSVTTPPLAVRGRRLFINADAGQGEVRVEVLDAGGRLVPGYSAADCEPIRQNSVRCAVTWSGSKSLPISSGPIKLRFLADRARLYSFWVEPAPEDGTYWHTELVAEKSTTALWHFNEASGAVANDSAGTVNNVCNIQGGATFVNVGVTDHGGLHPPADFGNALSLDGSTGFGLVADDPELEWPALPLAVEFWIKPHAQVGHVLSKYTTEHRSWKAVLVHDSSFGDRRFDDNAYHLTIRFGPGDGALQVSQAAATPIAIGQWQFVAIVFDSRGRPHVYINGVESRLKWVLDVDTPSIPGVLDSPLPLSIGCNDGGGDEPTGAGPVLFVKGVIDEVRISRDDVVTCGSELVQSISDLRKLNPGRTVRISGKVVTRSYVTTAGTPAFFYVEEPTREAGVCVNYGARGFQPGDTINVVGVARVSPSGEAYIDAVDARRLGSTELISPVVMNTRDVGGQPGSEGLYNQGILAKVAGRVTYVETGKESFWIDDGAGLEDSAGRAGLRVVSPLDPSTHQPVAPAAGAFVAVVGPVSSYVDGESTRAMLRPQRLEDIEVVDAS